MPLYEYQCDACGHRFENIQKFSDPLIEKCPVCGGVVHKLMSSPAIQFKGTGWYITDYAKKDSGGGGSKHDGKGDGKSDSKSEGKSDAKSDGTSESKSESKSDSKTESKSESKSDSKSSSDTGSSSSPSKKD